MDNVRVAAAAEAEAGSNSSYCALSAVSSSAIFSAAIGTISARSLE
jgi:hypothetical protein